MGVTLRARGVLGQRGALVEGGWEREDVVSESWAGLTASLLKSAEAAGTEGSLTVRSMMT